MNVWALLAWPIPQDSFFRLFLHGGGLADAFVDAPIRFLALHVTVAGVLAPGRIARSPPNACGKRRRHLRSFP
jgi:hypothetical protein